MTVCFIYTVYVQLQVRHKCHSVKKSLFKQKDCNADWLYNKTFVEFSAGEHDVICTRQIDIDLG